MFEKLWIETYAAVIGGLISQGIARHDAHPMAIESANTALDAFKVQTF